MTNEPAPAAALLHEHTADRRNTQALVAFGNRLVNSLTFRTAYAAFPKEIIRPPHAWAERVYNIKRPRHRVRRPPAGDLRLNGTCDSLPIR